MPERKYLEFLCDKLKEEAKELPYKIRDKESREAVEHYIRSVNAVLDNVDFIHNDNQNEK